MFSFLRPKNQGTVITLKISGMHCTSCAMNIDGDLEDEAGVFRAETSYARSRVVIDFDPKKVTQDRLQQIIRELGYETVLESFD
jgi:copper chaperone CopZ